MRNVIASWFGRGRTTAPPQPSIDRHPTRHDRDSLSCASAIDSSGDVSDHRRSQHTLRSLRILSSQTLRLLETHSIITVGDLLAIDLPQWQRNKTVDPKTLGRVRRCRKAIRLALVIKRLNPRNARLLIEVYRHSPQRLAAISAAGLHKDIERYAMSSRGMRLLGDLPAPSLELVQAWVDSARAYQRRERVDGQLRFEIRET